MRKLFQRLRPPWDEKRKLIATGLSCVALLAAALLLPLSFRAPAEDTGPALTPEEKSALFAAWWYDDGAGVDVERIEAPDRRTAAFCEDRMDELISRTINDRARSGDPESEGGEYVAIEGDAGTLRVCRMWLETRGDWQNWLDVCFDADTGLVYYLYLSRECLSNQDLYVPAAGDRPTAASVAAGLARECGGGLRRFLDDGAGGGTALIACAGGGTLCYTVGCTYYDFLIDIRIGCV